MNAVMRALHQSAIAYGINYPPGEMTHLMIDCGAMLVVTSIPSPPTHEERLALFASLRAQMEGELGSEIMAVAMISEAWMVQVPQGVPVNRVRPSTDPHRVEVLVVATGISNHQVTEVYEIKRVPGGRVLYPFLTSGSGMTMRNSLMEAFWEVSTE